MLVAVWRLIVEFPLDAADALDSLTERICAATGQPVSAELRARRLAARERVARRRS